MTDGRHTYIEYDEHGKPLLRVEIDSDNEDQVAFWKYVHDTGGNFFGRGERDDD